MEASWYFERTLFYDRSPDVDDYYETSAELIFEKDPTKAYIEVSFQSYSDGFQSTAKMGEGRLDKQRRCSVLEDHGSSTVVKRHLLVAESEWGQAIEHKTIVDAVDDENDNDDECSVVSYASSTTLPAAMDQRQGQSGPPLYPGLPKLAVVFIAPPDIERFVNRTKNDFRIFHLRQRHSFSRLQVTKDIFELLLKTCHVFPRFNEYVIGFGSKSSETEVGPPPFRYRSIWTTSGNIWRGFECSYILRYVEKTSRPGGRKPWSLRQFAVYHRFKLAVNNRCSTWILVGASKRAEVRLDRYTRSVDDMFQTNPFELHVIFLDTAIANWRPYIAYLTQLVQEQSGRSSGFSIGSENPIDDMVTIEVEDHQQLKQIEDNVADLLLCLDSTMDTLTTFITMYKVFLQQQGSPADQTHRSDVVEFAFETKVKEISYTRKKAESLLSRIQNTRTLVSSLLEKQSGHNIDQQIQALQKLEKQGQDENYIMRELAEKNARDSSSMRILTIITMVYLPCTIVSNFYSTQFVSQVESASGRTTLEYTQNAWLFFAISIPLTIFTISIWFLWVNSSRILQLLVCSGNKEGDGRFDLARTLGRRRSLGKLPQ